MGHPRNRRALYWRLMESYERSFLRLALLEHHGSVPKAARTLGIEPSTLYGRLRYLRLWRNELKQCS